MQNVSQQVLRYLKSHSSKDNPIPTTKLAELFTTNSRTSINYYLKKLEADGKIRRSRYATITGSGLWYVPSSKKGKTVIYELGGEERTWRDLLEMASSQPNNPYVRELAEIMNYIAVISRLKDRNEMHPAIDSIRERLTKLSMRVKSLKDIVDALRDDPVLRDPDSLNELELERME